MRYLTDRKRAVGKGASGTGTEHHWSMTLSAVGLAFMVPAWLYIFGKALGQSREAVVATFGHPFPAILTGLILVVGLRHYIGGATVMIEDYARGTARKLALIGVTSLGWIIGATGLFALVRMAL
jgi:succinate dehydrogenase / fumarate reductase membrane anchor subunit